MKRRDFMKTTAAVAGAAALGAPFIARAQQAQPEVINVGHLVGICMSPLFYAHAKGYFKDEGLNVQLKFMPNPGDAITTLVSNAMDIIHNPFTNAFVAAGQGAPIRIIAGSGAGGLVPHRAEGVRHQEHGRSRRRQGQGAQGRHHAFQHLRAHALSQPGQEQRRLRRLQHRLVQRHAVDGVRVRGQGGRRRHPCRAVRDAPRRCARRRPACEQSRRLGSRRSGLRDQDLGAIPGGLPGRGPALSQGDAARRCRDQGGHGARPSRCSTPANTIASTRRR